MQNKYRWQILIAGFLLFIFGIAVIHPFLAVTDSVKGEILVVEGWLYDRPALKEVVNEFKNGNYRYVVTVGGPVKVGSTTGNNLSSAELAAKELAKLGLNNAVIIPISVPFVENHRTYCSASALRERLIRKFPSVRKLNVFTIGVHARKSRILFQTALGSKLEVGIIAAKEAVYERMFWWLSYTGIRLVSRNTVGYLYARIVSFLIEHGQIMPSCATS